MVVVDFLVPGGPIHNCLELGVVLVQMNAETNKDAPRYKLVRVDLNEPTSWTEVLQESEMDVLESAAAFHGNQVVVSYLSDVKNVLQLRDLKTEALLHDMPFYIGKVSEISAWRKDNTIFIKFTNFLRALDNERLIVKASSGPRYVVGCHNKVDKDTLTSGTRVVLDMTTLTIMRALPREVDPVAYNMLHEDPGNVNYSAVGGLSDQIRELRESIELPMMNPELFLRVGIKPPKPRKLCIEGESNGGLLIGACINQRPDLCGCALAHVGVLDMLRFHKFTIVSCPIHPGHAWTSNFGCSKKEEEFHWLYKYSPLQNVRGPWEQSPDKAYQYPSTMLLTANHNDRVVPLLSLKLLAVCPTCLIS